MLILAFKSMTIHANFVVNVYNYIRKKRLHSNAGIFVSTQVNTQNSMVVTWVNSGNGQWTQFVDKYTEVLYGM